MSENKINEDNCVLSENEMTILNDVFGFSKKHVELLGMPNVIINIDMIFQKINKLNDLAKEKSK